MRAWTITLGLASAVAPGPVLGIDAEGDQLDHGRRAAAHAGMANVSFEVGSCYELPADDGSFDRVFSHALLEHLADPVAALREARRVLRPGGLIGVCSPDWGAALLTPPSQAVENALQAFQQIQLGNGGDPWTGRRLGAHLTKAAFDEVHLDARYERYTDVAEIAELLAVLLDQAGENEHAHSVHSWSEQPEGVMFAEAWVSATAVRPR